MRFRYRNRGRIGVTFSLVCPVYTYSLWLDWPRLTKFHRRPL